MIDNFLTDIPLDDRSKYLSACRDLVTCSRSVFSRYSNSGFKVQKKSDQSILTEVDTEIESSLRNILYHAFPEHGVRGEEAPDHNPDADFQWVIDPIDGTEQYVSGMPTYGTILSLYYKNIPLIGLIDHPALHITISAGAGLGAFCNDSRLDLIASKGTHNSEPRIVTAKRANFLRGTDDSAYFDAIVRRFPYAWVFDNCYAHTVVITGAADAMVEYKVKFHDISALPVLVNETGGKYVSLRDKAPGHAAGSYSAAFGVPDVVDELVEINDSF
jgi:fructose-1,6-bisphosphatase/inositol monophosphatase family enzyme